MAARHLGHRSDRSFMSLGKRSMDPLQNQDRIVPLNQLSTTRIEKSSITRHSLSLQIHSLQGSGSHFNLPSTDLLTHDPRPLRIIPPDHLPEGVVTKSAALKGITGSQLDVLHEDTGATTYSFAKGLNNTSSHDMDASGSNSLNSHDSETAINFSMVFCPSKKHKRREDFMVPKVGYLMPNTVLEATTILTSGGNEILTQGHALKHKLNKDKNIVDDPNSKAIIPSNDARSHWTSDKLRREKIADGIKALQNSVPCSDKGNKESVLDDAIDYIKFLKLQLKILSQSRLCGEATPYPFVHLEGYGHYFLQQPTCSEPLEEMMGQMMNLNYQAANELLLSKGLVLLPMASAYALLQAE